MVQEDVNQAYGVPAELQLSVIPLTQVEMNQPVTAQEMKRDPAEVARRVAGYDAALPLGISRDYVERRGLDDLKALRELVQNGLDEAEEVLGRPEIDVRQDELGLWVADGGRGLPVAALTLGAGDKACWMRGYYGEGLKLAAAHFALGGHPVYAFAQDKVYKFAFVPEASENSKLHAVLGRGVSPVQGTEMLVHGLQVDPEHLDRLVAFNNPDLAGKTIAAVETESEDCPHAKLSAIYDHPNELYIRNMYVGPSSEVAKRRSLFSYDLWWFRLDVSRTLMTYSVPELFRQASQVFERSPEALRRYAEVLVETEMIRVDRESSGATIRLEPTFGIFEGHLFIYAVPAGLFPAILEVAGLGDRVSNLRLTTSAAEAQEARRRGLLPLLVSEEVGQYIHDIPRLKDAPEEQ
jgi:hypothetical protein